MKADFDQFREFLDNLPKQLSLDRNRSHWVKYAFHFTDIRNAAAILNDGRVRCRADLERDGRLIVDIASPKVLAQTETEVKNQVRLYFRPRTPTQFRMEGIRPKECLWQDSHCPVPVFFLFDSLQILGRNDCLFSDGNLAKLGFEGLYSKAAELASFDFRKIYHESWVSDEEKSDIVSHRNAEIVIPKQLDLTALKLIYCRSAAEKETLLHLLTSEVRNQWASKVVVASTATLFYRKWVFVETAILGPNSITLNFSPDPQKSGPFNLKAVLTAKRVKVRDLENFDAVGRVSIGFEEAMKQYRIEVYLDEHLAYAGFYDGTDDIPF